MIRIITILASAVILMAGCTNEENNTLIKIGNINVLKEDLKYRVEIYNSCYKEVKTDTANVLAELIRDNIELAVLESAYKITPPDSVLEKKSEIIDKNTQAPEILKCIKSVYKENKAAYLRNLVSPTIVNPQLHSMFSKDSVLHKIKKDSIKLIQNKILAEKNINPKSYGYEKFVVMKPTKKKTTIQKYSVEIPADPIIEKVIKHLKPGNISNEIYNDEYTYRIVRLVSENDTSYTCDGIILKKESFDNWFMNYVTKNLKIEIYDEQLFEKLKGKYHNVWWWSLVIVNSKL